MSWLLVPIIIWATALIIMGLPKMWGKKMQKVKTKLKVEAESAKHTNPEESIYKGIEEGLLEMGSTQNLCFVSSIIGLLLMALGTVALCAVLLL
ncbi:hypothetical protein [Bacillus benzoevorans]|uniref:Uncharacterized protein n=1 Tax=Bacillus benzoevorans TaxID=1456 RepID=A0A7X0HP76_9BACI|nr:hypothetical protein [Bacillus benzoevorans]MBB6444379.1 hypothetical protein [Bacillus benzoevorans]